MSYLAADDDYLDYYQFEHDPFLGRGPSFKFFAAKRRPILIELHHLARYSKLMLVVTGPEGSGKTVLRQALVASSKEHVENIVITANVKADAASMLQQVCAALNLVDAEIADVLEHIERMLITGQEVHVLVDNAERLDESALLFLQRIAQGVNDVSARVFVFSDSSICPLLEKVADNAGLHHVIALEAWDQQEVTEYLAQRLQAAGQQLDVFTEQQLNDIYQQSQGWPGQVNNIAKELLIEQMNRANGANKTALTIPYKHLAVLAVLGVALLFVWFMQGTDSDDTAEQLVVLNADGQAIEQSGSAAQGGSIELPLELSSEPVLRAPLAQAVNAEDADSADLLPDELADELESQQVATASPAAPSKPVPISTPPAKVVDKASLPAVTPAEKKPAVVVAPVATKPAVQKPAPAPAAAPALKGSAGHSQWYKQQGASRYTLQVLGTRSEATARNFVQQDTARYHYFRKEHQGEALFVVTYGSFADRDTAQAAINNLPEKVRNDKPWPRTLLSIQQELR